MCCKLEMGMEGLPDCMEERTWNTEFLMCLVSIGLIKKEEFQEHVDFFEENGIFVTFYQWQVQPGGLITNRVEYMYREVIWLNLTESDWKYTRGLITI